MKNSYFLSICLHPVLQKTIVLPCLRENKVNRSGEYYFDASGKGVNVCRVLTQLKEHVLHLTQAGGRNRELFLHMLALEKIPVKWVDSFSEIRFCYTLFTKEHHTSTEIVEEAVPVGPGTEKQIMNTFLEHLPLSHTIIISGTKAAGFSDRLYPHMVREAKKAGKLVVLDFRGDDLKNSLQYSPDIIKPNRDEFIATFFPEQGAIPDNTVEALEKKIMNKMMSLQRQYNVITVLTNGSKPVLYYESNTIARICPPKITPLNTTGCGDAFTAGFASEFRRSRDITKAVKKGLSCGRKNALTLRPGYLR